MTSGLRSVALSARLLGASVLSSGRSSRRGSEARAPLGPLVSTRSSALPSTFVRTARVAAAASAATGGDATIKKAGPENAALDDLPNEVYGMVLTAKANYVRVEVEEKWQTTCPHGVLLCNVKTLLKKMQQRVLVGDKVKVESIDWQDGRGLVGEVVPRKSELADPPIANVDHVLLVFAVDQPPFDITQVTRFLVSTEAAQLPITVALNKCDLLSEDDIARRQAQLAAWGYNSVPISVHADVGLEALDESLKGRISVLAGPSGVGKSSIINHLRTKSRGTDGSGELEMDDDEEDTGAEGVGETLHLASLADDVFEEQRVSNVGKTGRGRHTTRHTTLLMLPNGGIVADTPGFNQPALESLTVADVSQCFPEIRQRLADGGCQFNDCRHIEEPGCLVRGDWERYELYLSVLQEVQEREDFLKTRSKSKMARQGKVRYKSEAGGGVRAEVLLNHKKHRRTSRKQSKQKFQQDILGDAYRDAEYD